MKKTKVADMNAALPRTSPAAMAPAMQPEKTEMDKQRDGEYDLDHLLKAQDIQNDPARMKYVGQAHAKKTVAMRSIADLKMASQALADQKKEELGEPAMDAKANAEEEAGEGEATPKPRAKQRYPKR